MVELLFLLLPCAAFSGWCLGRRACQQESKDVSLWSKNYFRGINFLLNEQPDKAVDVFIKMLEVDSDTVETHLALGNLFRRRGEADRAIRIHQNLIARPTLTKEQRVESLFALGEDYMSAGVLDRAEHLFLEITRMGLLVEQSLEHLIEIYQQQRDWEQAIAVAKKLELYTNRSMGSVIAHYYCELAEQAREAGQIDRLQKYIKLALSVDAGGVRAYLLKAAFDSSQGSEQQAIRVYKRLAAAHPEYMSEILLPLERCYDKLGNKSAFNHYLLQCLEQQPTAFSVVRVLTERLRQWRTDQQTLNLISQRLQKMPSIQGIKTFIELHLGYKATETRDPLLVVRELINRILINNASYRCQHCGFSGNQLHWQCPSCRHWDSVQPIAGSEGDTHAAHIA